MSTLGGYSLGGMVAVMARGTEIERDTSAGEESPFTERESAEPSSVGGASPAGDHHRDLPRIALAALHTAIEAIPSPTFVLRAPTTVLLANRRRSLDPSNCRRSTTSSPRSLLSTIV